MTPRKNFTSNLLDLFAFLQPMTTVNLVFLQSCFFAAKCKAVYPFPVSAGNNFSVFISVSLKQIHNASNVSILPATAARCHAIVYSCLWAVKVFLYGCSVLPFGTH